MKPYDNDALSSLDILLTQGVGIAEKILGSTCQQGYNDANNNANNNASNDASNSIVHVGLDSIDMDSVDNLLNDYNNNFLQIQGVIASLTNDDHSADASADGALPKTKEMLQRYADTHAKVQACVESIHNELVGSLNATRKRKQAYKGYGAVFVDIDKSFLDNEG